MVEKRTLVMYRVQKSNYDFEYDKENLILNISNGMQYDDLQEVSLNLDEQIQLFEILKDILEGE